MDIKGKVFIVTGAASGLGEGTARALAAKGGIVVIADMQADKGEAVAKDIGGAFVKCDVSNEADGQAVVAHHLEQIAGVSAIGVIGDDLGQLLNHMDQAYRAGRLAGHLQGRHQGAGGRLAAVDGNKNSFEHEALR